MNNVQAVLKFAAVPAIAVVTGGALASIGAPGPRLRSAVQHIAAGVLFAALGTELLPDVMHRALPWMTLLGFSLGVACMLALKALAQRLEARPDKTAPASTSRTARLPVSLLLVSGIDILVDGLLIGISFAAGERQGLLLTIALTLEVAFLGVATASAIEGERATRRVIGASVLFATLLMVGAGVGSFFLQGASIATLDVVMSFGMAALLYLVTEELLTEAHEVPETAALTAMFFVGFVALLMIEMFM